MKLLLDQNLSYKLCDALADLYPGSTQARLIGLDRADDLTVWRYAAREGYMLVTQDTDVRDLAALHGARRRSSSSGAATSPPPSSSAFCAITVFN